MFPRLLFVFLCFCVFVLHLVTFPRIADVETIVEDPVAEARRLKNEWNKESLEKALVLFQEAASRHSAARDLRQESATLREAGSVQLMLGNKEGSFATLKKALLAAQKAGDAGEEAKTLGELSSVTHETGDKDESEKYIGKAETLMEASTDASVQAQVLWRLGDFHYNGEEFAVSEKHLLRSVELWRQIGDVAAESKAQFSLGHAYVEQYKYDAAVQAFQRSLDSARSVSDRKGEALALIGIGTAHLNGDPQKALNFYHDSLNLFPEGIDQSEKGTAYNGRSSVHEDFGDYDNAISDREKALELFKQDGSEYGQMTTLLSLGQINVLKGNDAAAGKYFLDAQSVAQLRGDSLHLVLSYLGMGDIDLKRNDREAALKFYLKAKTLLERNPNKRQMAAVLDKIAEFYFLGNELNKAEHFWNASFDLSHEVRDLSAESYVLYKLAVVDAAAERWESALRYAQQSVEKTESLSSDVTNSQLKGNYLSNAHERYELYIDLLMRKAKNVGGGDGKNHALRAMQVSERARARMLHENMQLSMANVTRDASPEMLARERELSSMLNGTSDKLSKLLSTGEDQEGILAAEKEVGVIQDQLESLRGMIKGASPVYFAIKNTAPFNVETFQRDVLDDESVFLEFSLGKHASYLWLVEKNGVSHYFLPPREQIENQISALLGSLRARESQPGESIEKRNARIEEAKKQYPALAAALSNSLLGPVAEKIKGKRLIVSPDVKMAYLPLYALPVPYAENSEWLMAANEVVYAPSASILMLLKTLDKSKQARPDRNLLVFADPVFDEADERFSGGTSAQNVLSAVATRMRSGESIKDLRRLPASGDEAESIRRVVPNSTIVSSFEANRERLLDEDLKGYKVIHFATHGIRDEKRPDLSGIVLSRYDESGKQSEGLIRAQDIYGLDINADLIVLSLCDSGAGKEVRGEGIVGLSSAFLRVGARSVVSSLWKVDDQATEKLMREFYGSMAGGKMTASQALRAAQLKMLKDPQYNSPFYWAAFTAHGDTSRKIIFSNSRTHFALTGTTPIFGALACILLLAAGVFFGVRYFYSTSK